jgi:hypothetical protein
MELKARSHRIRTIRDAVPCTPFAQSGGIDSDNEDVTELNPFLVDLAGTAHHVAHDTTKRSKS